jgi:CelD/BcsL family acetyltransferase involved in cellulose biosynthesis
MARGMNMATAFPDPMPMRTAMRDDHARWAELAAHACEPNPFYHPALLQPALDILDTKKAVRLFEAYDGDLLIGLLPVEAMNRHGRYPFANLINLAHQHCFFGAPMLRKGHEAAAWASLLAQADAAPWAGHFLHLVGQDADGPAMAALDDVCHAQARAMTMVGHYERAQLASPLSADIYWETHVRAKKRKELRRLINRLEENGNVVHSRLTDAADLPGYCEDFLTLEASGWKGARGSALNSDPASRAYFLAVCTNAFAADMLDILRIDVDGKAIAMLVNFRHMRGSFSYKIAIDENFGRFSPGVLIELDNLRHVQGSDAIDWMDSCAMPGHPMIDSLWAQRKRIAQYRVALKGGARRAIIYTLTGLIENALRRIKGRNAP